MSPKDSRLLLLTLKRERRAIPKDKLYKGGLFQQGPSKGWAGKGEAGAYRKEPFQNNSRGEHWRAVTEDTEMLSQEEHCLLERDIHILVCQ